MTPQITSLRDNVDLIKIGERSIYLVGTAHVSKSSADLAESVIREFRPDSVAIELCEARYQSLRDPDRWKNTDIVAVIRQGKAYVLMAQLMLHTFQKKLGEQLDVKPGLEMLRAADVAGEVNARIVFADRNINTTLKRTWHELGPIGMCKVIFAMTMATFKKETVSVDEIERMKRSDALEELMSEFSRAFPGVKRALIEERDQYLASKIAEAPGNTIVAVVGAGHVPGIKHWIGETVDRDSLDVLPRKSKVAKAAGWAIPAIIIGFFVVGLFITDADQVQATFWTWFVLTGFLGAVGAAVMLAHPVTVVCAFICAPFAVLNPFVAAGWIAGLVEAFMRKPRVSDLENIADDIQSFRGLVTNRVSKILLIVASTNLFVLIGTLLGAEMLLTLVTK